MIDPAIRIVEIDPHAWSNLLRLLTTPAPAPVGASGEHPSGGLVVLRSGPSILKALHVGWGAIRPAPAAGIDLATGANLLPLVRAHNVRWAAVLEAEALAELMHRVQQRVRIDQDFVVQALEFAKAAKELVDEGRIHVYPRLLASIPVPTASVLQYALDVTFPNDRTVVAYLFEGKDIWTSVIIRKSRGQIDLVAGHRALGMGPGEVVDFRRDYSRILEAVRQRFGEPVLGFFAEHKTLEQVLADERPGAWARAYAGRDIIVDPMTPWAGLALGAGAVREAFDLSKRLLSRLDPLGLAQPFARAARERLSATVDLKEILGFDPFEVIRRLIRFRDD